MRYGSLNYFSAEGFMRGTRVLMRLDANIDIKDISPLRITRAIPEIENILEHGGKLMLMTHWGRPKGKEATLSTRHLIPRLELLLERKIIHVPEFSRDACDHVWKKDPSAIVLFENVRFFEGEEENDRGLAKQMASTADIYINNAFGVCHRKHASVHRITKYLPSYAGSVLKEEIAELNVPFEAPFVFVLGGAKMETKIPLLKKLAPKTASALLGSAFVTPEQREVVQKLMYRYPGIFHLPLDVRIESGKNIQVIPTEGIDQALAKGGRILDIGPETEMAYASMVLEAKSVLWNGPVGIVEEEEGKNGTLSLIDALQQARQARVVIGGGDTIDLIHFDDIEGHMFLSTGGGATLAYLSGAPMPGLHVL